MVLQHCITIYRRAGALGGTLNAKPYVLNFNRCNAPRGPQAWETASRHPALEA